MGYWNRHSVPYIAMLAILIMGLCACGPTASQEIVQVTALPDESITPRATAYFTNTPKEPPTDMPTVAQAVAETKTPVPTATPNPTGEVALQSARAIIMATDIAMKPDIAEPLTFVDGPVAITFDEFYNGFDMRKGLSLSEKLLSLDGQEVVMEGYMAPPLKPRIDWFVLTSVRLEFCPFCSSGADWPTDIAVIYLEEGTLVATQVPVRIQGRMEIGQAVDPDTGMVSLVRIYADEITLIG